MSDDKQKVLYQVPDKERNVLAEMVKSISALRLRYSAVLNFIIVREGLEGNFIYNEENGSFVKEKPDDS